MKKLMKSLVALALINAWFSLGNVHSQTISDFETPVLPTNSYWNGSDLSGGFTSGSAWFSNVFTDWGGGFTSWSGFAYSNMRDTVTQSFTNQYSAITAFGYNNSNQYAVCYVSAFDPLPRIRLIGGAQGDSVSGFYITNSTYTYLTMKNGDAYAKKFGGPSGTDPDWYAVVIYGYYNGMKKTDSVVYYLADYRFPNSADDYIVKDWQWVDLTVLGLVDSLEFNVFSSDTGAFGINTPTYFCMDNFTPDYDTPASVERAEEMFLSIYPNPVTEFIYVYPQKNNVLVNLYASDGKLIKKYFDKSIEKIDVGFLGNGLYFIEIIEGNNVYRSKFIKE